MKILSVYNNIKSKKITVYAVCFFAVLGIFAGGAFFGYSQRPEVEKVFGLSNKEISKETEVDFSPFWKAWNIISSKYISKSDLDEQKMVWGAIEGLAKSLGDPHTVFFPPQEAKDFQDNIRGDFEGVGMEIGVKKGVLTVIAPIKDSPAFKAGIKAGDRILKIDDKISVDMTAEEAVKLIRGKKGTVVKLTVAGKDKEEVKEINITRDTIRIPISETEQKSNGVFVIKLYSFGGNSANLFRDSLQKFINSGSNKLIIDLRGNPGGYLESAVETSSWFLPGDKVVVKEKFSDGSEGLFKSRGYDVFKKLPIVFLVNEGSASASEIMAGALQDHGLAKLVGTKTYGKGSVQELFSVTPETSIKLTIAKWLTPNGRSISDSGLEPDYKVEITQKDLEAGKDPQMEKALEIINNWKI